MSSFRIWRHATVACAIAFAGSSWAAPVVFSGTDSNPGNQVPAGGNAASARAGLVSQLGSKTGGESFERFAPGTFEPIVIGGGLATLKPLAPTALGSGVWDTVGNGRFNTTAEGARYWQTSTSFEISFEKAIAGFGFYGTDFGDFDGTLTLELLRDGQVAGSLPVGAAEPPAEPTFASFAAMPAAAPGADGSLLFFGFHDDEAAYDGVRFVIGQSEQEDFLGFDDLLFALAEPGDPGEPGEVPEPATLALAAVALAGAAAGRRRRR